MPADSPAVGTGSGTYRRALCDFAKSGGVVTVGSGAQGIGSKVFKLCRDWYSSPATYSAKWSADEGEA